MVPYLKLLHLMLWLNKFLSQYGFEFDRRWIWITTMEHGTKKCSAMSATLTWTTIPMGPVLLTTYIVRNQSAVWANWVTAYELHINVRNPKRWKNCINTKNNAVAGDRTRVTRVTGGNTHHYTTTTLLIVASSSPYIATCLQGVSGDIEDCMMKIQEMEDEGRNFRMWCKAVPNHTMSMFFGVRWRNFVILLRQQENFEISNLKLNILNL